MNYFKKSFLLSLIVLLVSLTATAQVGIGTATPSANTKFEIIAAGSTSATTSLRVGTVSGTTLLSVKDNGSVGIGTLTPASSASLEVNSTTGGFLPPRMSNSQKQALTSPAAGLIIWCTDCGTSGQMQFYDGTMWRGFAITTADIPTGGGGTSTPTVNTGTVTYFTSTTADLMGSYSGSATTPAGFYYSTSPGLSSSSSPSGTYSSTTITTPLTPPTFTKSVSGLTSGTVYYVRAFVTTNGTEVLAANTVTFTTSGGGTSTPTVTTNPVMAPGQTSASFTGSITSGSAYNPVGFYYSTSQVAINNLTVGSYSTTTNGSLMGSTINASVSGLTSSTEYFIRAFASTISGTVVPASNTVSFTTQSGGGGGTSPSIAQTLVSLSGQNYSLTADINSFGGSATSISSAYFEYSQSPTFISGVLTTTGTIQPPPPGSGRITGSLPISALTTGTWYFRAVATNNLAMTGTGASGGQINAARINVNAPQDGNYSNEIVSQFSEDTVSPHVTGSSATRGSSNTQLVAFPNIGQIINTISTIQKRSWPL
jgi:hypothetical protein